MSLLATLQEIALHLIDPWLFMSLTLRYIPSTILSLLRQSAFSTLLSPSAFGDVWFGNFWAFIGPQVKANGEKRVIPLLQGRVSHGLVGDEVVNPPVSGVVLEVGAGSGMWADVFAQFTPSLERVYGIEPNLTSAAALRRRVKDVGLEGTYEVVPVGIEALNDPSAWAGRIEPGSVDCIVTILCLCSIPEPEKNIRLLYECLKKGGRWYAYEHVQVEAGRGGFLMGLYQRELPSFFFYPKVR